MRRVAKALVVLRGDNWVGEIGKGMTNLRITVANRMVTHEVKVKDSEQVAGTCRRQPCGIFYEERTTQSVKRLGETLRFPSFPAALRSHGI
jgi:hypothetical protein